MKRIVALRIFLFFVISGLSFAGEPYWWDSAHRDDTINMYERGSAVDARSEQEAVLAAVVAAKNLLIQRIGILPALGEAGISSSAEYAIVNIETSGVTTEKTGKTWSAWLLVKYPQKEKQALLDRWSASVASLQSLRKDERKIPSQFGLSLRTVDMRTQFRDGETIVFAVTAEEDCHLLLVDHMSDGSTVLLYPNRYNPDSFVRKGQQILIPSPADAAFKLIVTPPFGDDRIEAIASTKKSSLHGRFSALVESLPDSQAVAVVTRGIFVQGLANAVDSSSSGDALWSRAELTISTYSK